MNGPERVAEADRLLGLIKDNERSEVAQAIATIALANAVLALTAAVLDTKTVDGRNGTGWEKVFESTQRQAWNGVTR